MIKYQSDGVTLYHGDVIECLKQMDEQSVNCCVTSPPYWGLRDYGVEGQLGLEETPEEYVEKIVEVFREVKRVLRDDGTVWLNVGDSYASALSNHKYAGSFGQSSCVSKKTQSGIPTSGRKERNRALKKAGIKQKDLVGIPWMLAFALRADGWYLRRDIIWHKTNPMPESVKDRPTASHEYIFLLSKSSRYYYDKEAIKEPSDSCPVVPWSERKAGGEVSRHGGSHRAPALNHKKKDKQRGHSRRHTGFNDRWDQMSVDEQRSLGANKRDVWTVATKPFEGAHFATFNPELISPCILAGSPVGGVVLDPFMGSGTTAITAHDLGRQSVGCELNGEYLNDICIPRVKAATKQQRLIA